MLFTFAIVRRLEVRGVSQMDTFKVITLAQPWSVCVVCVFEQHRSKSEVFVVF